MIVSLLGGGDTASLGGVFFQGCLHTNKHTSTSEWRMSREMECLCSILGLKSEKEECSDSDFFSRKGCLLPQDGDKS